MNGNQAIARILQKEGAEYLFCFPANGLIDTCAELGIRPILTRTERTLVNMADGYTRVHNGRRIGICAVQQGPGAENAFAGIAQAASDCTPILVLPGGPPRARRGVPYAFHVADNYRGVARWADEINLPERIPEMLRRAFVALRHGRRGPVLLEVPADVAFAPVDAALVEAYRPPRAHRSMADPDDVEAVANALAQADRLVIQAGHGALYAEASAELGELARLLQAPVMTTMAGKSAFPEDDPLSLGAAGRSGTEAVEVFLQRADLVFGVGTSFSRSFFAWPIPDGKRLIQLTADERDLDRDYVADLALVGDVKLVLRQLIDVLRSRQRPSGDTASEIAAVKQRWLERWGPRLTSDEEPLSPYRVIADLMRAVDRRTTIVTHDSGSPRDQMLPFYEALEPRGYLGWGKSTQLGMGYGLAMGARLAAREKLVVNVMGDAAFGMVGMEVETAARLRIGVLTIILNNSAMGGYEKAMPIATERYGSKFLSGNYTGVAASLGAHAERVERVADLIPAIQRGAEVARGGCPAVLEVIVREEHVDQLY
jgi:uncharacterized protein